MKKSSVVQGSLAVLVIALALLGAAGTAAAQAKKPNILVIFGDDVGYWNVSAYNQGMIGYKTPNIDRIAKEGALFTNYYGQQSCTAGRAAFITGQSPIRTGLTKVGLPGSPIGLQKQDPTLAELLKPLGYLTFQNGKNHFGDRDEFLPTVHGFDVFFGNLYHPSVFSGGTGAKTSSVVFDIICRRFFGIICRSSRHFFSFRSNYRWMNDAEGTAETPQKTPVYHHKYRPLTSPVFRRRFPPVRQITTKDLRQIVPEATGLACSHG